MTQTGQPRLLVVDDEEAICEGCRRILSRQGFSVDKTSDPREGLSRATDDDYAAILLDIKMPEMTGLDFLSALRSKRRDTPVILMTGFPSVPSAVSAIRLGAAGYVTKPFTPEEITQAVHRFAAQHGVVASGASGTGDAPAAVADPNTSVPTRFWHDAWLRQEPNSDYRCGATVAGLQEGDIQQVRLPKIGGVVYQGLPIASLAARDGREHLLLAPATGVVTAVHTELAEHGDWLVSDPCGAGWIAEISATRDEDELPGCPVRGIVVLSADAEVAEQYMGA